MLKKKIIEFLLENNNETNVTFLFDKFNNSSLYIKLAIIDHLPMKRNKKVNQFLVDQLKSTSKDVIYASITALGVCGTIDEIEPLSNINYLFLKSAAKKSIQMIQSKINHCEEGLLSLCDNESSAGQLSIVE